MSQACHICGGAFPDNNNRSRVTLRPCVRSNDETEFDLCRSCFKIIEVHMQRWRNNFHSYDMRDVVEPQSKICKFADESGFCERDHREHIYE